MSNPNSTLVYIIVVSVVAGGVFTFLFMSNNTNSKNNQLDSELSQLQQRVEQLRQDSLRLKYEDILEQNPLLANYTKSSTCREKLGFVYFNPAATILGKPRVNLLTFNDEVIGVMLVWPAGDGWLPSADQKNKVPANISGVLSYTQRIYFKSAPTALDCASLE